jgi:hypothetical protein
MDWQPQHNALLCRVNSAVQRPVHRMYFSRGSRFRVATLHSSAAVILVHILSGKVTITTARQKKILRCLLELGSMFAKMPIYSLQRILHGRTWPCMAMNARTRSSARMVRIATMCITLHSAHLRLSDGMTLILATPTFGTMHCINARCANIARDKVLEPIRLGLKMMLCPDRVTHSLNP